MTAGNIGDASTGGTVTVTDDLPEEVEATSAGIKSKGTPISSGNDAGATCPKQTGTEVICTAPHALPPYEQYEVEIRVKIKAPALAEPKNVASVSGGGAPTESAHRAFKVNEASTQFGVESYALLPEESQRIKPDREAGSHPFQLTTTFNLNQALELYSSRPTKSFRPRPPSSATSPSTSRRG